jgi:hypothetical protein
METFYKSIYIYIYIYITRRIKDVSSQNDSPKVKNLTNTGYMDNSFRIPAFPFPTSTKNITMKSNYLMVLFSASDKEGARFESRPLQTVLSLQATYNHTSCYHTRKYLNIIGLCLGSSPEDASSEVTVFHFCR